MIARARTLWRRVPRPARYALVGVLQVCLIGWLVFDRVEVLRRGREVVLQTRAIDPRDLLRGDYVSLRYAIGSMPAGALKGVPAPSRRARVYVKLVPGADGTFEAAEVSLQPIATTAPEVLIRGRVIGSAACGDRHNAFCDTLTIDYGIGRYFVPQGEGRAIEAVRNQGKLAVVAAVAPDGRAAIKRLLIDGKPVYDEPLF
jgi:uncharacterized membrane-anchored protein